MHVYKYTYIVSSWQRYNFPPALLTNFPAILTHHFFRGPVRTSWQRSEHVAQVPAIDSRRIPRSMDISMDWFKGKFAGNPHI